MALRLCIIAALVAFAFGACPFAKLNGPCPHASLLSAQADVQLSAEWGGSDPKPDVGQKTVQGCTCKSVCKPSITDLYACDRCDTGNCGRTATLDPLGLSGKYDYCVYPTNNTFESQSAAQKMEYFWKRITADPQRAKEYGNPVSVITSSVHTTFDNFGFNDELPAGRTKVIHSIGSICKFEWKITSASPYTGLFAPGKRSGLIRMGSAASYDKGLTPGVGVKFPRTNKPSGNYVGLHSTALAQSWNFFASNLSNHLPPSEGIAGVLAKKFEQASQCAAQVGISDMARYAQDGTEHAKPKQPFKLVMVPSAAVQQSTTAKTVDQNMAEFAAIPVGSVLYTVYACGAGNGAAELNPTATCAQPLKLGDYVTTSKCTTSKYGDEKLHFRHQRIDEDWQLNPEFLSQYDAAKACGRGAVRVDGAPKKCAAY